MCVYAITQSGIQILDVIRKKNEKYLLGTLNNWNLHLTYNTRITRDRYPNVVKESINLRNFGQSMQVMYGQDDMDNSIKRQANR